MADTQFNFIFKDARTVSQLFFSLMRAATEAQLNGTTGTAVHTVTVHLPLESSHSLSSTFVY